MKKMDTEITRSTLIEEPCAADTTGRSVGERTRLIWLKKLTLSAAMFCVVMIGLAMTTPKAEATAYYASPTIVSQTNNSAKIYVYYSAGYSYKALVKPASYGNPSNISGYSDASCSTWNVTGGVVEATVSGLADNMEYYYTVLVTDAAGGSPGTVSYTSITSLSAPQSTRLQPFDTSTSRYCKLEWDGSGDFAVWRKSSTSDWSVYTYTSTLSFTDSSCVPGETYSYCTTKANGKGLHGSTGYNGNPSPYIYNFTFRPIAPGSFWLSSATYYDVTLNWTASTGATGYRVEWGTSEGSYGNSFPTTGTSVNFNAFPRATLVYGRIIAYNSSGDAWSSYPFTLMTKCYTPNAPNATAGVGKNTLTWTTGDTAGVSYYKIYRSTSSGSYTQIGTSATTSYTDTTPVSGTTYYYKVSAQNTYWESDYSNASGGVTSTLSAPTALAGTANGTTGANLTWTAPAGATSYTIYRSATSGGTFAQVGTSPTASFSDTGLSSGTKYYYKVTATNSMGTSAYSTEASVGIPCTAPVPTVTPATTQITLNWPGVNNATSYTVKRSAADDGVYEDTLSTGQAGTTYTNTGLTMDTNYYYAVYAVYGTPAVESAAGTVTGKTLGTVAVTFDGNGGTPATATQTKLNSSTYGKGADGVAAEALPTATRTGYTFVGWWTAASGGTQVTDTTLVNSPTAHILYAHWTANTVTITYDTNGGSPTPATQTKLFDSTYGKGEDGKITEALPANITRLGYVFKGWNTAADGKGTPVTDETFVKTESNHTLYAQWGGVTMTVTYNNNDGTGATSTQDKLFDSKYGMDKTGVTPQEMPKPSRTGYNFDGWFTVASGGTQMTDTTTVTTATSHILYAHWTAKTVTVSFNANGTNVTPSSMANQEKKYDSPYNMKSDGTTEALPVPTRTGYAFAGWFTAATDGTQVTDASKVTTEETSQALYAHWTAGQITVNFIANGTNVTLATPSQEKKYDSSYDKKPDGTTEALPVPTRTGYTFAGWWTAATDGTQVTDTTTVTTAATHSLYAHWTALKLTVSFNVNGADVTPGTIADQEKKYDSTYDTKFDGTKETLPAPTRTGCKFAGWWTAATDGTQVTDATIVTNATGTQTLYAHWDLIPCSVTYDGNGNTSGDVPTKESYFYGKDATVKSAEKLEKVGYDFEGWKDSAGNLYQAGSTITIKADITLYASWTLSGYELKYNGNGHTNGQVPDIVKYYYQDKFSINNNTEALERVGYDFDGWNTASNGSGTPYKGNDEFTAPNYSLMLYAQWKPHKYLVTYNGNGYNGGTVPTGGSVDYDTAASISANTGIDPITKTGNTFMGWNTQSDGKGTPVPAGGTYKMKAEDLTLYAVWEKNNYKVTYDGNGYDGGSAPGEQNAKFEETVTASINTFTKTGNEFFEWNTAPDGTGIKYVAGEDFKMGAADLKLYAIWYKNKFTLSYDKNTATEGDVEVVANEVPYGTTVHIADVGSLKKTGHDFKGWNSKSDGSGTPYEAGKDSTMPNTDLTLYAQWTPHEYTITIEENGGDVIADIVQKYDTTISTIATPSRTGYVFYGWYLDSGFASPVQFPYTVTGTATVYAKWVQLGDADISGSLNAKDSTKVAQVIVGITPISSLTPQQLQVYDANGDGAINAKDSTIIRKKILGLI